MSLNMRNIVIGAIGSIAENNKPGIRRAFFSFAKDVDPVTKLDEFGTHEDDIFYHADYEKELKTLMNGVPAQFLLLDYELRYLHGAHAPSPYRYVVALMNPVSDDWDERFYPACFDDAESWTDHLISWDVDNQLISNALDYINKSPKEVRSINVEIAALSVYNKANQKDALTTSFHVMEISRSYENNSISIFVKFYQNEDYHAYDVTDIMYQALGIAAP